jgi:hypothetical protein
MASLFIIASRSRASECRVALAVHGREIVRPSYISPLTVHW